MSQYKQELPYDIIKELNELAITTPKMMGNMTKAGAEVVKEIVDKNLAKSFKSTYRLRKCLFVTKTYRTPSDDSINNKVMIYGYLDTAKKKPAPLVALAREYGTSRGEAKKPFFRPAFKKKTIEEAMLKEQEKYLPKE